MKAIAGVTAAALLLTAATRVVVVALVLGNEAMPQMRIELSAWLGRIYDE